MPFAVPISCMFISHDASPGDVELTSAVGVGPLAHRLEAESVGPFAKATGSLIPAVGSSIMSDYGAPTSIAGPTSVVFITGRDSWSVPSSADERGDIAVCNDLAFLFKNFTVSTLGHSSDLVPFGNARRSWGFAINGRGISQTFSRDPFQHMAHVTDDRMSTRMTLCDRRRVDVDVCAFLRGLWADRSTSR